MSTVQHAPQYSVDDARRLARDLYDLDARAEPLPSERDQNFRLLGGEVGDYILKIANAKADPAHLDFENRAMMHLAEFDPHLCIPRLLKDLDGRWLSQAGPHFVRLLSVLPGKEMARFSYHSPELLRELGRHLGRMDRAWADFFHPAMNRPLIWDLKQGLEIVDEYLSAITGPEQRDLVEKRVDMILDLAAPRFDELRTGVIFNDANDYNILISQDEKFHQKITGIVDFGDMMHSWVAGEPAVACAYAMMNKKNPLAAAAPVVAGFHEVHPLTEAELACLFPLICLRLCMSVSIAAHQKSLSPDNPYLSISESPAWDLLKQLSAIHPRFAEYTLRQACGLEPCGHAPRIRQWLRDKSDFASLVNVDLSREKVLVFDLSAGSPDVPDALTVEEPELTRRVFGKMLRNKTRLGLGRYDEARLLYRSDGFQSEADPRESRSIHLGVDLFMAPGTPLFAPLDGTVHSFGNNTANLDYGPTLILKHHPDKGICFYTLYGHLSKDSLEGLETGQFVKKGQEIARIGDATVNGGWTPHVHFQIMTDMLDYEGDFPGVALPSERAVWKSLILDGNLILKIPEKRFPGPPLSEPAIIGLRRRHLGPALSLAYERPLKIIRGFMQHLFDESGRVYLDAVNNVPQVGHSHPRVVEAVQKQMALLCTNTRYLHDHLAQYLFRLSERLPDPLSVGFIVNSGSEANDLALRLARAATGHTDVVVVDGAYHGHLGSCIDLSPYKFNGRGGKGRPGYVQVAEMPDPYRGRFKGHDCNAGEMYAQSVLESLRAIHRNGRETAAFFCESLLGCGGQIVLPEGYMKAAFAHVRNAGGVCVADEVQVGFGRVGSRFWGFETQDVVPDIVTMGKPMGNGFPLAAVFTTREIAEAFSNGMEYFNTFGGNPVSCAAGLAVLDVIEEEGLQENARIVGAYLKEELGFLKNKFNLVGDVRGLGLYIGVELVRDRKTLEPADREATYIVNRMKENGILMSTDGPLHNVLKIKPPLVFTRLNAECLVETLDRVLSELL